MSIYHDASIVYTPLVFPQKPSLTFASANSSHAVNNSLQLKHGHAED